MILPAETIYWIVVVVELELSYSYLKKWIMQEGKVQISRMTSKI